MSTYKRLRKAAKAQAAATSNGKLNPLERLVLNADKDREAEKPHVNLKYYEHSYECFSCWEPSELAAFSDFLHKLRSTNWQSIFESGGKRGNKTGFGYTIHKNWGALPNNEVLKNISPDITCFELRVTQKMRVHGFRAVDAFYLIWLDRRHRIYAE